jgi:hypothetical protein
VEPLSSKDQQLYERTLREEEGRVEVFAKLLASISDELHRDPHLWGDIVAIGLRLMFESSDFPVPLDPVLNAGFSPDQWFIQVPKASADLAISIAKLWWKPNPSRISLLREKLKIPNPETTSPEALERIQTVLNWHEIIKVLSKRPVMVLGLAWLLNHIMETQGISYPEAESDVQNLYWKSIEKLLDQDRIQLFAEAEQMASLLVLSYNGPAWAEIIRFPW